MKLISLMVTKLICPRLFLAQEEEVAALYLTFSLGACCCLSLLPSPFFELARVFIYYLSFCHPSRTLAYSRFCSTYLRQLLSSNAEFLSMLQPYPLSYFRSCHWLAAGAMSLSGGSRVNDTTLSRLQVCLRRLETANRFISIFKIQERISLK